VDHVPHLDTFVLRKIHPSTSTTAKVKADDGRTALPPVSASASLPSMASLILANVSS
jgi:hypothetical protein